MLLILAFAAVVVAMSADGRGRGDEEVREADSGGRGTTPAPRADPEPAAPPVPTRFFGVSTPSGPYNMAEVDAFEAAAGKEPAVVMFSQDWANARFRADLLQSIADRSGGPALPLITWEPRDHRVGEGGDGRPATEQPEFSLSRILEGSWDWYIREWAEGLRAWGRPVGLRLAQQMNGNWFPWAEGVNGNERGQYVAAWRHVRRIFDGVGTPNVLWVWSPNVSYKGSAPLAPLYPGDGYVDWVGIDGYNGGTALGWGGWIGSEELFAPTIREIRVFTSKPLALTEVGSSEEGGSKARWIHDFFHGMLPRHPEIMGFVWVEAKREADWRIVSSESATAAFAAGVADRRFGAVPFSPR